MNGGDNFKKIWMYLVSLDCANEMVKMVNFVKSQKVKVKSFSHV